MMNYKLPGEGGSLNRGIWLAVLAVMASAAIGIAVVAKSPVKGSAGGKGKAAVSAAEVPVPGKAMDADAARLVSEARLLEEKDDLSGARDLYERALSSANAAGDASSAAKAEKALGGIFIKLVFSQREMAEKVDHAIVAGDLISKLARKHGTTPELIAKANGISNPDNIKIGDRLRILSQPGFEITVNKAENWLLVTMRGKFFKRYTVGTGKYNRTPAGTFRVSEKITEPSWWKDNREIPFGDKENILGTRWMAISSTGDTPPAKGYGIHGTWEDKGLGRQSSAGCVRMSNKDVEELFAYIPEGTPVTIIDGQ